jgi:hypothetical protein
MHLPKRIPLSAASKPLPTPGVGETGCIADARSRVIAVEASYRTIEAALKAEIDRLRS